MSSAGSCAGLTQHGEVPQQRVTQLPVSLKSVDVATRNQSVGLFGGIDHLAEQERLTPRHKNGCASCRT